MLGSANRENPNTNSTKKGNSSLSIAVKLSAAMILIIVAILIFSTRPIGVVWKTILFVLTMLSPLPIMYVVLMHLFYHASDKAKLIAPPVVTNDEEKTASDNPLVKLLDNPVVISQVVPLLLGVLIDFVTRHYLPLEAADMAAFNVWRFVLILVLVPMFAYAIAARFYQVKSGIFLTIFTDTYAKRYALFRKEDGFRKLATLAIFLLEAPVTFGLGWLFVTGFYLLISKTLF